jgi:CHAT domain-containing protein
MGNPLLVGDKGTDLRAWEKQDCPIAKRRAPLRVAGIAIPQQIAKYFRGDKADVEEVRKVAPLPETADELCAVGSSLGAGSEDVYLGSRATEANLKKLSLDGKLAQYQVLHFATHGLLPSETGRFAKGSVEPALILTPPDKPDDSQAREDDGLLMASEVSALKLDADWVILSACNTAAGGSTDREALSGLAQAFFFAGSRALLVSHWYVDSDATVGLITKLFQKLASDAKLSRADALRQAMLDLVRTKTAAHPGYWAPFVLVGDGRATRSLR